MQIIPETSSELEREWPREKLRIVNLDSNIEIPLKHQFTIKILSAVIRIHLDEESFVFVSRYLADFESGNEEPNIDMYLTPLEGEKSSPSHKIWWDPEPCTFFVEDSDYYKVFQRDYFAKAAKDLSKIRIYSACFNEHSTDILDNINPMLFSHLLTKREGLVIHASCIEKDGEAYVFFGKSGAGKSTIAEFCYKNHGQKVIGTDQVFLSIIDGELWAQASPRKSPEFPRGHEGRITGKRKVRVLAHLTQRGDFFYQALSPIKIMQDFIYQTMPYCPPTVKKDVFLSTCSSILSSPLVTLCEMSYPKNQPFWDFLTTNINEN